MAICAPLSLPPSIASGTRQTVKTKPGTPFTTTAAGQATERAIRVLAPANEAQRLYQSQAIQVLNSILQTRLVLYEQSSTHLPVAFLAVLIFWLFILFASFSLFSPLNPTALAAIVVIALSASGAIFLILEMSQPFSGLMQIDSAPVRQALAPLGRLEGALVSDRRSLAVTPAKRASRC